MKKPAFTIKKLKTGGEVIPFIPGESMDDYIEKKNNHFFEYIANSTQAAINDESKRLSKKITKAGDGLNIPPGQPITPTSPAQSNNYAAYYNQSLYQSLQTPGYVQAMQQAASPFGDLAGFGSGAAGTNAGPAASASESFPDPADPTESSDDTEEADAKKKLIKAIAAKALTVIPKGLNTLYSIGEAKKNAEIIDRSRTIENTASSYSGKRGDYNVNSGSFRQNLKTTPYYALGGTKGLRIGDAMEYFDGYQAIPYGDGSTGTFDSVWGGKTNVFDRFDPARTFGQGGTTFNLQGGMGRATTVGNNSFVGSELTSGQFMPDGTPIQGPSNNWYTRDPFDPTPDVIPDGDGSGAPRHLSGRPMLKKGGTYKLSHSDILRMKGEGYEFEILD